MHRTITFIALTISVLLAAGAQQLAAQTDDSPRIRLKSASFDPLALRPSLSTATQPDAIATGNGVFLVQFDGPVQDIWKRAVQEMGVKLYGYVPDYAFIARLYNVAPDQIQQLPFVRWVGPYQPAYKLDEQLTGVSASASFPLLIDIQTLPDTDLIRLEERIAAWGGVVLARSQNDLAGYLRAELPSDNLSKLITEDGVLWVTPYAEPRLENNVEGGTIMQTNAARASLGLYGRGQIVAVADSGLDTGRLDTLHPDVRGRVRSAYCLGRRSPCDWSDPNGHGTHVVGSVLGNGVQSGSNPATRSYGNSFAGVAPEAQLVMQSILDASGGLNGIPLDTGDLMRQAYRDGARIHSNSWGGMTCANPPTCTSFGYGGYDLMSQQADAAAWQHKDMLILFAAGNDGVDANKDGVVDPDSINQPGTAKNVVTVGATESNRPEFLTTWGQGWPKVFTAAPIANDPIANDPNGMAAFSGRGPTDDGRIKPDVVAPGTFVVSARSQHTNASVGWGAYSQYYAYNGGTSMATPLTAGAAALVREWLTTARAIAAPSSALIKAILINGAVNISPGQYGTTKQETPSVQPNAVAGWGRVNVQQAVAPSAPKNIWLNDHTGGIATGEQAQYTVSIGVPSPSANASNTTGPVRMTLAWTDYPGQPSAAKALVNDLDLEVIGPNGTRYRGNQGAYASGHRCLRNGWDACNNLEGITIPQAQPGIYTIVVRGAQVPQGGKQPFAIAVTGDYAQAVYRDTIFVPLASQ